jgi:hypothetical protein
LSADVRACVGTAILLLSLSEAQRLAPIRRSPNTSFINDGACGMRCVDRIQQELDRDENRERESRLGKRLDLAIEAVEVAWQILATEIRRFGYTAERPVPDNETRYCYFHTMKFDALEMFDSIYWSLQDDERAKEDRDFEEFESTYVPREHYSRRIKALAFLTASKALACSDDDPLA